MPDIKPGKKYFSVIFEIEDPTAFTDVAIKYSTALHDELVEQGARVTACGWGDYATERDAYANHIQNNGIDTDEVVLEFMSEELGQVGSFPNDEDLNAAVRDILG